MDGFGSATTAEETPAWEYAGKCRPGLFFQELAMRVYFDMEVSAYPTPFEPDLQDYTDCDSIDGLHDALIEALEEQACISTMIDPDSLKEFWVEAQKARGESNE